MDKQIDPAARRIFCKCCLAPAVIAASGVGQAAQAGWLDFLTGETAPKASGKASVVPGWKWSKKAGHFKKMDRIVQCQLCPNGCRLHRNGRGTCRVRVNKNDVLYSLVYGNPAAIHIDPIEKKPLYHFYPGTDSFSLGFAGCNLSCLNCQNWELSQKKPEELQNYSCFPHQAVETAMQKKCRSIAYTYNEPSVVFEFMHDTARLAHLKQLKNVWVTNGYINREPLLELCECIDGANVDLKSFSDDVYRKLNFGRLQPVLDTLKTLHEQNVWFEITTLIVPAYTDDSAMIRDMCAWIVDTIGGDHPIHFSRFGPHYKLKHLPPTPPSKLLEARDIARSAGINYVYIGNYRTGDGGTTFCPGCRAKVIERIGYVITGMNLKGGACGACGHKIAGRWS
ncbi:MAG: AmmeMemoRadiSam system radical SAM enzyme [Chitinivibrionales bacterium]|nr:AmmeMemoRadiSam system radical SAM enzyme [Chitinivibrionales bacterium]